MRLEGCKIDYKNMVLFEKDYNIRILYKCVWG